MARVTDVPAHAITGRRRTKSVSRARFIAITEIRKSRPHLSLAETGDIFRRDHGTVIHAERRYGTLRALDEQFDKWADESEKLLTMESQQSQALAPVDV